MVQVAPYKVCCEKYSVKCCDGCHRSAGGYATAKSDVSAGRPLGKKKKNGWGSGERAACASALTDRFLRGLGLSLERFNN